MSGFPFPTDALAYSRKPEISAELPRRWQRVFNPWLSGTFNVYVDRSGLTVLESIDTLADGTELLHVSVSHKDRLPSWNDLKTVKRIFFGAEGDAWQRLPPESEYVNLHKNCLHLWGRLRERHASREGKA